MFKGGAQFVSAAQVNRVNGPFGPLRLLIAISSW